MSEKHSSQDSLPAAHDTREYPAGTVILRQGDTSEEMFIIESGRVEVSLAPSHGTPVVLATLGVGDFFGEMSFFADRTRSASVTALTVVRVHTVERKAIEKELSAGPPWFRHVVLKLVERIRYANLAILGQADSQSELMQLERLQAAMSVAGAIAHEVNQPLTVLIAATQLLELKIKDPSHAKTTATIVRSGHRVAEILRKLQSIRTFVTKPYAGGDVQILDLERATEDPPEPES